MIIIKPNEEKTYTIDISKMYKLNSSEFVIIFKKSALLENGKNSIKIISKPVKFTTNSSY